MSIDAVAAYFEWIVEDDTEERVETQDGAIDVAIGFKRTDHFDTAHFDFIVCISEWSTDLYDGDQSATANCIKITSFTDGVDWGLVVLESDSYESDCLLLAVQDLKHLQKAIFATTEQQVFFWVYKNAVTRGALLLFYFIASGERENGKISIDVRSNRHELAIAKQNCPLGAVNIFNKIDVLFAVVSQQFYFRTQWAAYFIEDLYAIFMEYAKTSFMLIEQAYISTAL